MSSGRVILPLPGARKRPWLSLGRLWVGVIVVFSLQLGLVVWFGERRLAPSRSPAATQSISTLSASCADVLQLLNPTLFALPHENGFSGAGWLIPPVQEIQPFTWSEPARWLTLASSRLGSPNGRPTGVAFEPIPFPERPEPDLLLPQVSRSSPFPGKSYARFEGDLANLQALTSVDLPSWPHTDLLHPTVVQVLVDADGIPFSVSLLERSGHAGADKHALNEGRRLRFKPVRRPSLPTLNDFSWGTIVFEWHTLPSPPSSSPPPR